jgi:hypothetical protein
LISDSKEGMNTSQLIFFAASQFLLLVDQLKENWIRWVFFILRFATGEGFRIESCRDYECLTVGMSKIHDFFLNEYDITVNVSDLNCILRIDSQVKNKLFSMLDDHIVQYFQKKMTFCSPVEKNIFQKSVRFLDLTRIKKRSCLIKPTIDQVQMWIMDWKPSIGASNDALLKTEIDLENTPAILGEDEIKSFKLSEYRDPQLEQPFGLICSKCNMQYQPNIYARICLNCQNQLLRA